MKIIQGLGAILIAVTGWGTIGLLARLFVCGLFPDLEACRVGPAGWFAGALAVGAAVILAVFAFVAAVYIFGYEKRSQNT
jgi:hypothetical protein